MAVYELEIREASHGDGGALVDFLNQVGRESDYMSLDQDGIGLTQDQMDQVIENFATSSNQLYLLLLLEGDIVGLLCISADQRYRVSHIGDLFMVVKKAYWNQGLASILMEEALFWAKEASPLLRLQLSVQVRNQAALALYQKFGFEIEGQQEAGLKPSRNHQN